MKTFFYRILRYYLENFPVTEGKKYVYRKLSHRLLPEQPIAITQLYPGFRMRLDLTDDAQREIYFYGTYERKETVLLKKLLTRGDVFWDVGASIGYYSLFAGVCVGPEGRVISFEPLPSAFHILSENLELNHMDHIQTIPSAVGKVVGTGTLYFEQDIANGVATLAPATNQTASVSIPITTLDTYMNETQARVPTVVKADIEGAEGDLIEGGKKLLSCKTPPILFLEMEDENFIRCGTSKSKIQHALEQFGYSAYHIVRRKWVRCDDVSASRCRNYFWFKINDNAHRMKLNQAGLSYHLSSDTGK